ncbi:TasA family protein [Paenibacillus silvisoli]|uniref:TasA family protein n=1 Tax=Paenibacillus silvisoli TaxID=3110539 RepID=UPI002805C87D|nr:TasA family protein [Paenibacillus silvisoli]
MVKGIKSKLVLAMATTALGATLLAGGTYAIFTANAANTNNTFATGSVVINLDLQDDANGGGPKYFAIPNMAPGDSGNKTITITNNGTLQLRYDIATTLTGPLSEGATPLTVTLYKGDQVITPGDNNIVLNPGQSTTLKAVYALPLAANNDYQGDSAEWGITVNAEQTKNN